jgi:hypothetical protein
MLQVLVKNPLLKRAEVPQDKEIKELLREKRVVWLMVQEKET